MRFSLFATLHLPTRL